MVSAAPGISDEEKASLVDTVEKMANSETWKTILEQKGWANTFLAGDDFQAYLKEEIAGTKDALVALGIAQ